MKYFFLFEFSGLVNQISGLFNTISLAMKKTYSFQKKYVFAPETLTNV